MAEHYSDHPRPASFVLRIWWEQDDDGAVWRGWIQHAVSGDTRYFHRLADLMAFVEVHTGPLDPNALVTTTLS